MAGITLGEATEEAEIAREVAGDNGISAKAGEGEETGHAAQVGLILILLDPHRRPLSAAKVTTAEAVAATIRDMVEGAIMAGSTIITTVDIVIIVQDGTRSVELELELVLELQFARRFVLECVLELV